MYKKEINIIPLNAFYTNVSNSFVTFDIENYNSSIGRMIYMKDEYTSYFKIKNTNTSPHFASLSIPFAGVTQGDILEVEFEVIGNNSKLSFYVGSINSNSTSQIRTKKHVMTLNNEMFIRHKTRIMIENTIPHDCLATYLSIGNEVDNSELTIKNIKITIYTQNASFIGDFKQKIIKSKKDMESVVSLVNGMTITENGELNIVSTDYNYKGIQINIPNKYEISPLLLTFEYKSNLIYHPWVDIALTGASGVVKQIMTVSEDWKKVLIVLNPFYTQNISDLVLKIGSTANGVSFSLRNIIIYNSIPTLKSKNDF